MNNIASTSYKSKFDRVESKRFRRGCSRSVGGICREKPVAAVACGSPQRSSAVLAIVRHRTLPEDRCRRYRGDPSKRTHPSRNCARFPRRETVDAVNKQARDVHPLSTRKWKDQDGFRVHGNGTVHVLAAIINRETLDCLMDDNLLVAKQRCKFWTIACDRFVRFECVNCFNYHPWELSILVYMALWVNFQGNHVDIWLGSARNSALNGNWNNYIINVIYKR